MSKELQIRNSTVDFKKSRFVHGHLKWNYRTRH